MKRFKEFKNLILEMSHSQAMAILGLHGSPSLEDIKKAYKKLALRYHPDKGGDLRKMQDINAAKDELISKIDDTQEDTGDKEAIKLKEFIEKSFNKDAFEKGIKKLFHLDRVEIETTEDLEDFEYSIIFTYNDELLLAIDLTSDNYKNVNIHLSIYNDMEGHTIKNLRSFVSLDRKNVGLSILSGLLKDTKTFFKFFSK